MRQYEKQTTTYDRDVCIKMVCDVCGASVKNTESWDVRSFQRTEVKVKMKETESYPECGNSEITEFDVCPRCFKEKLIPAMKALGAEPSTREESW